jgi:hypothetical protein
MPINFPESPTDGLTYSWNEAELQWDVIDFSEPQS